MPQALLHAKIHRPRLDRLATTRPGLTRRIEAGLAADVTLIVAPAGYGKTTAAVQWAEQAQMPVAWYAMDGSDNDLAQFLAYVVGAIEVVHPEACPNLRGFLDRAPLPDAARLAAALAAEIDRLPQRSALVLDDYHAIGHGDIELFTNELLRHPLRGLHLVIVSRKEPPLALARLRACRRLNELGVHDLRFDAEEAMALLAGVWQGPCSAQVANALLAHTEGWAAGLYLLGLALGAEPQGAQLAGGRILGADRLAADFLLEQVLLQQPPLVRDFLRKTSILDRMSPQLAAIVVDQQDHRQISLKGLAQAGLFLNPLDGAPAVEACGERGEGGEWYSYHGLFRSLLHDQLLLTATRREVAALHRRASIWFSRNGYHDEALQHAFAAGDTELAVQIVTDHFAVWLERANWRTIDRRLRLFPPEVFDQHPWFLMARAHVLVLQFRWDVLLPLLTRAEQQLADGKQPLAPAHERMLRHYLDLLWTLHWAAEADAPRAVEAARRALSGLPEGHYYAGGVLQLALTLSLQAGGEAETADQMLTASLAQAELSPAGSPAVLRPLFCLLTLYFTEGHLQEVVQVGQRLLHQAVETKSVRDQQMAHLALGAVAYEMNELATAVEQFQQGANLWHSGNVRAGHECLVGLALANQALGRGDAVRNTIAQLADFHADVGSSALAAEALSLQRRLGLVQAGFRSCELLRRSVPARTSMWYGWLEIPALTQVRAVLNDAQASQFDQVEQALSQLWATAVELHKPLYQAALLAHKAVLLLRQQQGAASREALRQALVLGEERGLVRSIADAGPQLEPLLAELAAKEPSAYLHRVWAAAGGGGMRPPSWAPRPVFAHLGAPLTRREREVLALLGEYRTDREIAETLVISPLTVRTHIENLSTKLEVNGRRAIVHRAREHGLLA
jgi:LuxR family maltose regulon positive regulatory protein